MSVKNPMPPTTMPPECLATMAGYRDVPTINDSLRFQLPAFTLRARRYVSVQTEAWELWSPNSETHAFYPGIRQVAPSFPNHDHPPLPRADGHLGRFDATVNPQVFDPKQPWLPLIRRIATPANKYPEHTSFADSWDSGRQQLKNSTLQLLKLRATALQNAVKLLATRASVLGELWNSKPRVPSHNDVQALANQVHPMETRLAFAALQRAMKVVAAWCKFANLHLEVQRDHDSLMKGELSPAHEQFMGLWINGCSLELAVWYLRIRVPCFIVHTIDTFADRYYVLKANHHESTFFHGTEVEKRTKENDAADVWAREQNWNVISQAHDDELSKHEPLSYWVDRYRTTPRGQGWINESYSSTVPDSPAPCSEMGGWLRAPQVAGQSNERGSWTHWYEEEDDNLSPYMRQGGPEGAKRRNWRDYFDRQRRRFIHLEESAKPSRMLLSDAKIFGLQAPDIPWCSVAQDGQRTVQARSTWMYLSQLPDKGDAGKVYQLPTDRRSLVPRKTTFESDDDEDEDEVMQDFSTDPDYDPEQPWGRRSAKSREDMDVTEDPVPSDSDHFRDDDHDQEMAPDDTYLAPPPEQHARRQNEPPPPPSRQNEHPPSPSRHDHRSPRRRQSSRSPSPVQRDRSRQPRQDREGGQRPRDNRGRNEYRPSYSYDRHSYNRGRGRGNWRRDSHWSSSRRRSTSRNRRSPPRDYHYPSRDRWETSRDYNRTRRPSRSRDRGHYEHSSRQAPSSSARPRDANRVNRRSHSPLRRRSQGNFMHSSSSSLAPPSSKPSRSPSESSHPAAAPDKGNALPTQPQTQQQNENTSQTLTISVLTSSLPRRVPILVAPNIDNSVTHLSGDLSKLGPRIPTLEIVGVESRFLAIGNMPDRVYWRELLSYLRALLPRQDRRSIERVTRTFEEQEQIFWISCSSMRNAAIIRGLLHTRRAPGCQPFIVEFVHGDVYSARVSWANDQWSPAVGLELDRPGVIPSPFDQSGTNPHMEGAPRPTGDALERSEPGDDFIRKKTTARTTLADRLSDNVQSPLLADRMEARPTLYERFQSNVRPFKRNRQRRREQLGPAPEPMISDSHPEAM